MAHTPLPWAITPHQDTIKGPAGNVVAECCGYSTKASDKNQQKQGGREANAELIVKVVNCHHELLEAAKAALCALVMDSDMEEDFGPEIKLLNAAIEKATGE